MIVKGTKQLGSFRRGTKLYVPKRGASKTNELYPNGLYGKRYVGYFGVTEGNDDDVNWFNTATLHGETNQLTQINGFTNNDEGYSWQWVGYFKASSTENYTFYTTSDDASYVWIGDNAVNGYTRANAIVNNGGIHPPHPAESSPVSLVAGTYYPIRVQFGENGGGDEMSLSFSTPTIAQTTNGLGYYYYDPNIALAGSLLFNNQNQFLQFSRSETISILDPEPFTIEAWIKPTSIRTIAAPGLDVNGNPTSDYGDIIIGDTADGGNNWSLQLFNNKLTFYRYNGALKFFTSNSQIPLNEWTHVAVAYDGVSTLWIFVNGTLDATFDDYSRPSIQYSVITIGNLFDSGNTVWANGAYAYKGYITNLRINDNQTFYQMVSPFKPTAPLKHIFGTTLLLLANTNQPIKDSSPSNRTITNVGSVTSSSQYPTVVDCSNNDAKVLMVGWPGPRPLTRVNENLYIYYVGDNPGDETLDRANSSSPWVYKNAGNEIVRSLTVSQFPWQGSWPSTYTATKVCPTPAPSGIPVAGTNSIIVNGETYTKGYATFYYIEREVVGDEIFGCTTDCGSNSVQDAIVYRDGSWKFERNWLNGGPYRDYSYVSSTNPSTNSNFIPTAGWSPSLTITAAPSGISVANTNTIFLRNALSLYQSTFGSGYSIGNPQSFSKFNSYTYFDGSVNYIRHIGYWQWYWDNGDNSYNVIDFTSATDPNFIPNDWGNGITITDL